ncbi:Uncharacterised protein [Corynebacterium kutscheri]|uniref:Uncharacterized protein n=1 Tax=Corynebacterium kutscheri TaxID=35755 RepID=A0A0F6QXX3_9CORY|nr:hypothetical protein [Corynebacterium kutscheri]AKE40252.1 hypothetical protein UL82_00030 [Corynebacterium kutscheri]VEH05578.1 Uncharacterised protein [Corynebacterium kutscheri]VEH10643.1 Uncharacterised protein [Corynebacterium kutscheri]VEH81474.1 Uncharacterised protein [Corynebacterium kutscheri]
MSSLTTLLEQPREAVVTDLAALAEHTIDQQSGISGAALKTAVNGAKKVNSDIIVKACNRMLPEFVEKLDPQWQQFTASGEEDFGIFLSRNAEAVVSDILDVLDRNVEKVNVSALKKVYGSMRGKAEKLITPHIPAIGAVLQKHM